MINVKCQIFKIFFIILLIIFFIPSVATALSFQNFISVKVNNKCIDMDSMPYVQNNRTLVSVRFISEALNAKVNWISKERKIEIINGPKTIQLFLDSKKALVNGKSYELDANVEISNNRTMVPVRFIAENLDCSVTWDKLTLSILINKENTEVPVSATKDRGYSDDEIIWLGRIVHVEGLDLSPEGKLAIANVILNRTKNDQFPKSIYEVIFDRNYCVQFPPAFKAGFKDLVPSGESIIAAKMALEGINNIDNCLYFNDVPFKSKKNDLFKKIDGQYFYL